MCSLFLVFCLLHLTLFCFALLSCFALVRFVCLLCLICLTLLALLVFASLTCFVWLSYAKFDLFAKLVCTLVLDFEHFFAKMTFLFIYLVDFFLHVISKKRDFPFLVGLMAFPSSFEFHGLLV